MEQVPGFGYEEAKKVDFEARRYLQNADVRDTIRTVSGARIINQYGKPAQKHADVYYGLIRSMTTDISRIANNTEFSEDAIARVKAYLFLDKHDLGGDAPERFASDFAIAQSWHRLMEGKAEPHDITLLRHEIFENELMSNGMSQSEAHILASQKYDYSSESEEYYGSLRKHKEK